MKRITDKLTKYFYLFAVFGVIYMSIEMIVRDGHYTHWSMGVVGGVCGVVIGLINEFMSKQTPLPLQMLLGCAVITTLELISGCILNLWLGLDIWHYDTLDILGQISLPSSIAWFFLSLVGIVLDDYIRYWFFGGEKPHYTLW